MATTKTAKKTTKKAASKRSAISKRMKEVAAEDKANRAQREAAVAAGDPEVVVPAKAATRKGAKGKKATTKPATKPTPAKKEKAPKQMSGLDAAVAILAAAKEPMNVKAIVEQAEAKGLWKSRTGKTPAATISAAIGREIVAKGKDSRFKKVDRGLFTATGKGV
jgi:hypothetical protein